MTYYEKLKIQIDNLSSKKLDKADNEIKEEKEDNTNKYNEIINNINNKHIDEVKTLQKNISNLEIELNEFKNKERMFKDSLKKKNNELISKNDEITILRKDNE